MTTYTLEIGRRYRFSDLPWAGYTDPAHQPLGCQSQYFRDQSNGHDGTYNGPHTGPYATGVEPVIAGLTPGKAYDFGRLQFIFWSDYAADDGTRDLHDWFVIVRTDRQTIGVYLGAQYGVEPIFARSSIAEETVAYAIVSNDRGPLWACCNMYDAVLIACGGPPTEPHCIDERSGVVTPLRCQQLQSHLDAQNVRRDEYGADTWRRYRMTVRYVDTVPADVPIYPGDCPELCLSWYGENVRLQEVV